MTDRPTGTPPGIAVGTRVRERAMRKERPPKEGVVCGTLGHLGEVYVRWFDALGGYFGGWYPVADLVVIAPPDRADAPTFPPGTVVRCRDGLVNLRGWDVSTGVVQPGSTGFGGEHVLVRWGDRPAPDWEAVANLEVIAPPVPVSTARADLWDGPLTITTEYVYAPERILAPGIVVSADTCGGKPRLAETRMPTDTARSWPDYETYHAAYPHISAEDYARAACFEAGVRWAKERRKAKKAKGGKHA